MKNTQTFNKYQGIDMHSHSYYSDGILSPTDLVKLAKLKNCTMLSLSDHDTTSGIKEAKNQAKKSNITLINGVEISAMWGKHTIHIIGLGVDINSKELQQGLNYNQEFRDKRAILMADALVDYGIQDAYAKTKQLSKKSMITRTHFARMLIKEGHCKNMSAVFKKFLADNKIAAVSAKWQSYKEVITWIKNANGLSVLAHPFRYRFSTNKINNLLFDFKKAAGNAMEVVISQSNAYEIKTATKLAEKYHLLASQGSDYHGLENEYRVLGKLAPMPYKLTPVWEKLTLNENH